MSSDKRPRLDDAKADNVVDANLSEHIEAQLQSASPVFVSGSTALHQAAQKGLGGVVARLLVACPFLTDEPEQSTACTALHFAAEAGHTAIVAQLLAVNPSLVKATTHWGSTALHLAAANGRAAIVTLLLAANPALINARTGGGWTALHLAVLKGQASMVTQLLAANPTLIDAKANGGWTVLHLAAQKGQVAIITQLLAANPALIDAKAENGRTALHEAAIHGKAAVVAQLLAVNPTLIDADPGYQDIVIRLLDSNPTSREAREEITVAAQLIAAKPSLIEAIINDNNSWTALLKVMKMDHEEAAARLLAMHPRLIHKTSRDGGWTVFHKAAYYGSNKVMSRLLTIVRQPNLKQLLLRRSTNWCELSNEGSTALHVAARQGNSNMVAKLLAACPSLVDVLDHEGQTCLHSAVSESDVPHESTPTVEVLLAFKPALIHAVDTLNNSILHSLLRKRTLQQDSREFVEKIWRMNPDTLHAVNCYGCTPFHYAVEYRNDSTIDLLQWSVTLDEIVSAYNRSQQSWARFKPLMQCEVKLLPDLVAMVFEYVGFCEAC